MANVEHVELLLRQGIKAWNAWRQANPQVRPDFHSADLRKGAPADWLGEKVGIRRNLPGNSESTLNRANLRDTDLRSADLRGLDLTNANLSGADLREARFGNNWFANASFRGANLAGVNLSGLNLYKFRVEGANLQGADLSRSRLNRAFLAGADFRNASFRQASIAVETAEGAKFHGADFTDVQFMSIDESMRDIEDLDINSLVTFAFADGLDSVRAGSDRIADYLTSAFQYAHEPGNPERKLRPGYLRKAIGRIGALRMLFFDHASPPSSLIAAIRSVDQALIRYLANHPAAMHQLRPRQFEELIAEILASYGWQVHLTPTTRDGGTDIIAVAETGPGLTTTWLVECKKWASGNKVDLAVVRALYGLRCEQQHGAALLATTSQFTTDAMKYKATRYNLHLRDYQGVIEWINTYRPNPNGKLFVEDNRLLLTDNLSLIPGPTGGTKL